MSKIKILLRSVLSLFRPVDSKYYRDVSVEVFGAVLSAVIITISFFIISDFIFKPPNLNGKWYSISKIDLSNHKQYDGMKLIHEVIMFQEENRIYGNAEKMSEMIGGKEFIYENINRVRSEINGYIDRNYFSRDKLHLHWIEKGYNRESSSYFNITRFNDNYMFGTFYSSVANSRGRIEWVRNLDDAKEFPFTSMKK